MCQNKPIFFVPHPLKNFHFQFFFLNGKKGTPISFLSVEGMLCHKFPLSNKERKNTQVMWRVHTAFKYTLSHVWHVCTCVHMLLTHSNIQTQERLRKTERDKDCTNSYLLAYMHGRLFVRLEQAGTFAKTLFSLY